MHGNANMHNSHGCVLCVECSSPIVNVGHQEVLIIKYVIAVYV